MNPMRVTVMNRTAGPVHGFTMVRAEVENGVNGDYVIANNLVGTQGELDEIRAQSTKRQEIIEATKAGQD